MILWIVLGCVAANWVLPLFFSYVYCLWLRFVSHDVEFAGWAFLGGIFPVAKWHLISHKSWYAKLWQDWYGCGLAGNLIYRDEPTKIDDWFVKIVIVHELRHVLQGWVLGALQMILYTLDSIFIYFFVPLKHPYEDNWFERDARRASGEKVDLTPDQWVHGPNDRWPWWSNPTEEEIKAAAAKWRATHRP